MSIFETFKNFQLTDGQTELLRRLDDFLESKDFCFLLKGYAGTGKTFMMKGLTDYLKEANRPFVIAAPTGRAAKVISQKTKNKAYTIHKTIYNNTDLKEYKVQDEDKTETFKFFYALKINADQANTVYIVDEASMVSDAYSEGEFFRFGSGFLLKDLIEYINSNNGIQNKKLIFIGDNAQLPPINMNFSPALSKEYLLKEFSINARDYELVEVVRQKAESGILFNATRLRNAIKDNSFGQLTFQTNFKDTLPVTNEEFLDNYLTATNGKIDEQTILVAHSNSTVKSYNEYIRAHYFPNQPFISKGDRVIVLANNYNYPIELLNGDFGTVIEVENRTETRSITLKKKDKQGNVIEVKIPLTFRKTVIEFQDTENQLHSIECLIIENLLYSEQRDLTSDEMKALYIDFWIRYPKLDKIRRLLQAKSINNEDIKDVISSIGIGDISDKLLDKIRDLQRKYFAQPNSKFIIETSLYILKEALKKDEYFNAIKIKFGYAVTCHKAQGGEWERVFVNCKTSMGYFNSSYFKWLYTALTRAKITLYTLETPCFTIGSSLKPPKIENFTARQDLIVLKPEVLETELSFDLPQGQHFLQNIFYAVFDLIKDEGVAIDNIKHHQYCEQYSFSKENNKAQINIYYTAQDKVGSLVKSGQNSELTTQVFEILQPLKGKSIIIEILREQNFIDEPEIIFSDDKPFLKEFHAFVKGKVSEHGITINAITSRDYLEKYEFKKNGHTAIIDFHYTGKNQFKKFTPQPSHSTSTELLKTICQIIGELK